jgi:alpha-amylase
MPLRFVLGCHNHQPVGNFGNVFAQNWEESYQPFLTLIAQYPKLHFVLHMSGSLLEWLLANRPQYVQQVRELVQHGQLEILGGAFQEPILPLLPRHDRIGQIRSYTACLQEVFGCRIRGMWLAERVWEPELASDLVEAGIEYTLLDDYHFKQAGFDEEQLLGYFLTEDEGRLLKVFPISEPMRYLVPWKTPEEAIGYLLHLSKTQPNAVVVCADDGEKFGGWPGTHKHCYTNGWLKHFFDLLQEHRDQLHYCTLAQAVDETPPRGLAYLPDCSYREMTEWALPTTRQLAYQDVVKELERTPLATAVKRSLRGGFWRNFQVKYPEAREMYARMMEVSGALKHVPAEEAWTKAESSREAAAKMDLYRGQCNCSFWHGAFGGLYLPHLRHGVFQHLIAAEAQVLPEEIRAGKKVQSKQGDLNLDGYPEVRLANNHLAAYFAPHQGGMLYELDLWAVRHNLLGSLARRPEPYHRTILEIAQAKDAVNAVSPVDNAPRFKQEGLEKMLHYDSYLRKSLLDHFLPAGTSIDTWQALKAHELGDFVTGHYLASVEETGKSVKVILRRQGLVGPQAVEVSKEIELAAGSDQLTLRYRLTNVPSGRHLRFGIEFNFAGLAANQADRYYFADRQAKLGQLQTVQQLESAETFGLADEWLGLRASLKLSRPGTIWAVPIQTVSQSEGGYEMVHQSNAVLTHWLLEPDAHGAWETQIVLRLDTTQAQGRQH